MSDNGWITLPVEDLVKMGEAWEKRVSKLRWKIDQKNTEIDRLKEENTQLKTERGEVTA